MSFSHGIPGKHSQSNAQASHAAGHFQYARQWPKCKVLRKSGIVGLDAKDKASLLIRLNATNPAMLHAFEAIRLKDAAQGLVDALNFKHLQPQEKDDVSADITDFLNWGALYHVVDQSHPADANFSREAAENVKLARLVLTNYQESLVQSKSNTHSEPVIVDNSIGSHYVMSHVAIVESRKAESTPAPKEDIMKRPVGDPILANIRDSFRQTFLPKDCPMQLAKLFGVINTGNSKEVRAEALELLIALERGIKEALKKSAYPADQSKKMFLMLKVAIGNSQTQGRALEIAKNLDRFFRDNAVAVLLVEGRKAFEEGHPKAPEKPAGSNMATPLEPKPAIEPVPAEKWSTDPEKWVTKSVIKEYRSRADSKENFMLINHEKCFNDIFRVLVINPPESPIYQEAVSVLKEMISLMERYDSRYPGYTYPAFIGSAYGGNLREILQKAAKKAEADKRLSPEVVQILRSSKLYTLATDTVITQSAASPESVDIWTCKIKNTELEKARDAFKEAALPRGADMHLDRIFASMSRFNDSAERAVATQLWNEVNKKLTDRYKLYPSENYNRPLLCNTIGCAINLGTIEGEQRKQAESLLKLLEGPKKEAAKPETPSVSPANKARSIRLVSIGLMPEDKRVVDDVMQLYRSRVNDRTSFMDIDHAYCFKKILRLCENPIALLHLEYIHPVKPEAIAALKEMTAIIIAFAAENLTSRAHLRQDIVEAQRMVRHDTSGEVRPILIEARKAIESMGRSPINVGAAGSPIEDIWTREIKERNLELIRDAYRTTGAPTSGEMYLKSLFTWIAETEERPYEHNVAIELWDAISEKIKAYFAENPGQRLYFRNFIYPVLADAIRSGKLTGEQLHEAEELIAKI